MNNLLPATQRAIQTPQLPAIAATSIGVDRVFCCDALDLLSSLPDASADMIFADLPYGVTACDWDIRIPFEPLWAALKRVIKPRGAMVFTASQPFTSMLVMSNLADFRYEWIWEKQQPSNFLDANRKPLKSHESVLVFGQRLPHYFPQGTVQVSIKSGRKHKQGRGVYAKVGDPNYVQTMGNYPRSVIKFDIDTQGTQHPTQKPVALLEYLIQTYTRPGELVVDPVCGSGTTGIAARKTGRHFIMGDSSPEYIEITRKRLAKPFTMPMLEMMGA